MTIQELTAKISPKNMNTFYRLLPYINQNNLDEIINILENNGVEFSKLPARHLKVITCTPDELNNKIFVNKTNNDIEMPSSLETVNLNEEVNPVNVFAIPDFAVKKELTEEEKLLLALDNQEDVMLVPEAVELYNALLNYINTIKVNTPNAAPDEVIKNNLKKVIMAKIKVSENNIETILTYAPNKEMGRVA